MITDKDKEQMSTFIKQYVDCSKHILEIYDETSQTEQAKYEDVAGLVW